MAMAGRIHAAPPGSYQINRQLIGWKLPPLVIRAFGAHCPSLPICEPGNDLRERLVLDGNREAAVVPTRSR